MRANLNREIDQQYGISKIFIENIQYLSPASKVYIVGYPQFISVTGLCLGISPLLSISERTMIHESVIRLNNILKKVAHDTGVYYVDIEDSLVGGRICEGSKYMTGPVKAIFTKKGLRPDANMYHPNHRGHQKVASHIASKIASGMTYDILDIPKESEGHRVIKKAVMPDYSGIGSTHTVSIGSGLFKANGNVYSALFSEEVRLGATVAEGDGSFKMNVTIPENVAMGVHLFTISGFDKDGLPLTVQQFINVTSGVDGDLDGDGIPDAEDSCFVIKEWYENSENICMSSPAPLGSATVLRASSRSPSVLSSYHNNQPSLIGDAFHADTAVPVLGDGVFSEKPTVTQVNDWWMGWGLSIMVIVIGVGVYYERTKK